MNKLTMWVLVVVAFVVGAVGGFYFERSRAAMTMENVKMSMQKQIDAAKMEAQNVMMKSETTMSNPTMMAKSGILTDAKGMTLYTFDKDSANTSTCYGGCAKAWPPYVVNGTVPTSLPAHLGTTKRTDGSVQYTWDSRPLYYYQTDTKPGDVTGDGVGGVWHVVK